MLRITKVLSAVLMLVPLPGLIAQTSGTMLRLEGERVRVRVAMENADASGSSIAIKGTVVSQRGDSIQVVDGTRLWNLSVSSVQSLDVSHGRDRWRSTGIGALAGVAFGLLMSLGPADCNDDGGGLDCNTDGTRPSNAQYVQGNVGLGVFAGVILGAAIGVERWERIMARPRVSVAPVGGGIGFRVTY